MDDVMRFASPVNFAKRAPGDPKAQPLLFEPDSPHLASRSQALLNLGPLDAQEPERVSWGQRFANRMGLRSEEEFWKVWLFMVAAFMGNSFFVIARNVGAVLFLTYVGPDYLTNAIFMSGVASVFIGQQFSSLSRGRSPALVNSWLLFISGVALTLFYFATWVVPSSLPESGPGRWTVFAVFFGVYMAEDILAMFVAMQCASVAQASFSVGDAKRLFGLVQLGNSFAAMAVGLTIGSVAARVGTEQLLLIQAVLSGASLVINTWIGRRYVDAAAWGGKKKGSAKSLASPGGAPGASEPWWKNFLVLAMGLWSFTVIFTKTMYEYEYNVLVATSMTSDQMVALTGYLYAGAGIVSTLINVTGTKFCLERFGMQGAILATPAALLSVSVAILVNPSVTTTFLGRLADLSLRWSLNNTVRTVLWIAVPPQQAAAAKPWVEGTIKKMGQAFNAVVIMVTLKISELLIGRRSLTALSALSLVFCTILFAGCVRVYTLYLSSMWGRIKRRELSGEALPFDVNLDLQVLDRLMNGGQATQIALLNHMRDSFSPQYWEEFFARFYELPAAVQVKILELGRKQPERVPSDFLVALLGYRLLEPSVLQVAILMVGERRLHGVAPVLEGFLSHSRPVLRAAAAVAIINIGWGVGLGELSSVATVLLETMLGEPLEGHLPAESREGPVHAALAVLEGRGVALNLDGELGAELEGQLGKLQCEWEDAIQAGRSAKAVMLAMQVTQVRLGIVALTRRNSLGSDSPRPVSRFGRGALTTSSEASTDRLWEQSRDPPERCEEIAAALHTMGHLVDPRALLPREAWTHFLLHSSAKIRLAALTLVREEDVQARVPGQPPVLRLLIMNLQEHETFAAAEAALARLRLDVRILEEVLEEFERRLERHKALVHSDSPAFVSANFRMMQLLKYLQRQCTRVSKSDFDVIRSTQICDRLLKAAVELHDPEVLQELYMAIVDLKDRGCAVSRPLAEQRILGVAETLCRGLAVQRWMKHLCEMLSRSQLRLLRLYLELPRADAAAGPKAALREKPREGGGGINRFSDEELVAAVDKFGQSYVSEHLYLQRLQLLYLAILSAPALPANYRATRVLAAWRVLRSKDPASEAAVIEVLDSMLPAHLKGIVLPLLDSSPMDRKLAVAELLPGAEEAQVVWRSASKPPPWAADWFRSSMSAFGPQFLVMLSQTAAFRPNNPVPSEALENTLLPKMFLISRASLFNGVLSMHLAELAEIASVRPCGRGKIQCQAGEMYVIAEGTFHVPLTGQDMGEGDCLQELHLICRELPALEIECTAAGGGVVVCLDRQQLFELMVRLTPKFALGILRNVVRALPAPESIGGSRQSRDSAAAPYVRRRIGTADLHVDERPRASSKEPPQPWKAPGAEDLAELARVHREVTEDRLDRGASRSGEESDTAVDSLEDTDGGRDGHGEHHEEGVLLALRRRTSQRQIPRDTISLLEKLVLLQEVKMFRYVPTEHLPDIAKCCQAVFRERGSALCSQGEATNATLYIVAEGSVGLRTEEQSGAGPAGPVLRTLTPGDTMGNTALLLDLQWPYSAFTLEDSWLLSINRSDLTDVLRGRRELASAVIHGLYKTFTRRIKNAVLTDVPREMAPAS